METKSEMADAMYVERVLRARQTPIEEKLVSGLRLRALAREAARAGIRAMNPRATSAEVETLLRQREELGDRLRGMERD